MIAIYLQSVFKRLSCITYIDILYAYIWTKNIYGFHFSSSKTFFKLSVIILQKTFASKTQKTKKGKTSFK